MRCCTSWIVRTVAVLAVLLGAFGLQAGASATLLIEEPYGKLGFFTATGHAAVYLSGVCAQTPLILRRCAPGESGVVLSRYDGFRGYDWIAIPLVPYLYASSVRKMSPYMQMRRPWPFCGTVIAGNI
jgi:hypothetical protein